MHGKRTRENVRLRVKKTGTGNEELRKDARVFQGRLFSQPLFRGSGQHDMVAHWLL